MQNFRFHTPTEVHFGRGSIEQLPAAIRRHGTRVLLVYGGGSIKRSGLYERVLQLLEGCEIHELGQVEPNPRVTSVNAGAELCRRHDIQVVLAVGGGSVIDCAKAICTAAFYEGDAWDMILDWSLSVKALPLVDVLTLSATGSEFDGGSVISNAETSEKMFISHDFLQPVTSILDPEYTYSVDAWHTAAGAADMMSHIMEVYFVMETTGLMDGICESVLRSVIANTPRALTDPHDYNARAELMWCASLACNGLCSLGNQPSTWACHAMEHELSAYYDITHGVGLAIVTPRWMRHSLNEHTAVRFARFARNVFGIADQGNQQAVARAGIEALEHFFTAIGIPATLGALKIGDEHIEDMARHMIDKYPADFSTAIRPLAYEDVVAIYRACL